MTSKTPRERFNELQEQFLSDPCPVMEVGIPMRDGVELAADAYLPAEGERPAPAIVLSTPYDKSHPLFYVPEAQFFQQRGYAFVIHDVRGRGKSEGEWRAWVHDGRDTHDVIEWTAVQPWCNGRVGTTGPSYSGWTQWAAAFEKPPHLTCMVSTAAAGRWMEEWPYISGCFSLECPWWAYVVRRRILEDPSRIDWDSLLMQLPVARMVENFALGGRTWQDWMEHDTLDEFWSSLRFDGRYSEIDVPCLHVSGWFDYEDQLGAFHHYENVIAHSPTPEKHRLIVGPWSHGGTRWPESKYGGLEFGPEAAVEMDEIHLKFFDYWLKSLDNGYAEEAPVRLFVTGRNAWRDADRWPLATGEELLYLTESQAGGRLMSQPPSREGSRSYLYDPDDPARSLIDFAHIPPEPPLDQTSIEQRADVLTYTSEPLAGELCVSGAPRLELFASSDCDDTEWHVKLTDVHPDGRSFRTSSGCLRASYRESLSDPSPIEPGKVFCYQIELNPITHVFLPGHRLRLSITSSDFPWFARNLNRAGPIARITDPRPASNTVHFGPGQASHIRLPVGGR